MSKENEKNFFCECFFEKCKEWAEFLKNGFVKRDDWVSHLIEYYHIHSDCIEEEFVKDFLKEREKILCHNNYKMVVKTIPEKSDGKTIGRVELYRKKHFIHAATLLCDMEKKEKVIYWSFKNEKND